MKFGNHQRAKVALINTEQILLVMVKVMDNNNKNNKFKNHVKISSCFVRTKFWRFGGDFFFAAACHWLFVECWVGKAQPGQTPFTSSNLFLGDSWEAENSPANWFLWLSRPPVTTIGLNWRSGWRWKFSTGWDGLGADLGPDSSAVAAGSEGRLQGASRVPGSFRGGARYCAHLAHHLPSAVPTTWTGWPLDQTVDRDSMGIPP